MHQNVPFSIQKSKIFWETPPPTPALTGCLYSLLARQFKEKIIMARHLPKVGQPWCKGCGSCQSMKSVDDFHGWNQQSMSLLSFDTHTHTHTTVLQLSGLSGTTRVRRYQKKHSPTHTYRGHQSSLICFQRLLWSMASSLFNLHAWHSFCAISVLVFFGLPLGLAPSTSYSIHFFTQSVSSFCNTCPYHRNLFYCSTEIMSSNPSLSLSPLLGTLSCSLTQLIIGYEGHVVY